MSHIYFRIALNLLHCEEKEFIFKDSVLRSIFSSDTFLFSRT